MLSPPWIKRQARVHRPSRPVIVSASVSVLPRRPFGSSGETPTGDDKEKDKDKRGRKARREAKSPLRLVSVKCNPAPDAEHRLRRIFSMLLGRTGTPSPYEQDEEEPWAEDEEGSQ